MIKLSSLKINSKIINTDSPDNYSLIVNIIPNIDISESNMILNISHIICKNIYTKFKYNNCYNIIYMESTSTFPASYLYWVNKLTHVKDNCIPSYYFITFINSLELCYRNNINQIIINLISV